MNRKIAKSLGVLLLLIAVAVTQVPVSDVEAVAIASDFEMDGNKLMKYSGTADVVSIPDGVKEIGEEAFAGNDNLIKVNIEGDVKSVGYRAFADCDNLRTIVVGDGVEEIETAAFSNNKELINVTLGAGVKRLGTGVFAGDSQLKDLSLSEDNNSFHYSNGILYDSEETKVYLLLPAYEKGAYTLPSTVTEIAGYAFWGNPYLEKVTLGSGLYEVPAYAFSNCMNLREVEIPLTVRGIGAKAFEDCVNLGRVTLPDSMAQISDSAFDGCPNVEFTATPGTYGAEFAAARKTSEVEEVEYEDVQDAEVIDADAITNPGQSGDVQNQSSQTEENGADVESGQTSSPQPDEAGSDGENVQSSSPQPEDSKGEGTEGQTEEDDGEPSPTPESDMKSVTETITNKTLLGQSSIVSGRAVIFIDNRQSRVLDGNQSSGRIDLSGMESVPDGTGDDGTAAPQETAGQTAERLVDNAQKGKDFPKYTIVNDRKIASQAFYQDSELTEYEIGEGITEIGEFAFARSGLTSVTIPEGVTRIEYGAFYHCDNLKDVTLPNSIVEIEPYAFDKTAFTENSTEPFLVAGDGILIAYHGSDSVVNIPAGVKQIGPGVFKDHAGITAVNLPSTVQVIGEEAFMNCRNLKTVNGGENIVKVKDRAFMNCPLSKVVIPASMEEVGIGAYALSNGTDTVVFEGGELPKLSAGKTAGRIANEEYRTYAFANIKNAIVPDNMSSFEGTVLENGTYGFNGIISGESGNQVADNSQGVSVTEESGVVLQINSSTIPEGANANAEIPGNEGSYVLKINDSEDAAAELSAAYGELYGGRTPSGLSAYEISLFEASGNIPISRLGKQSATVQVKLPTGLSASDDLHVVTLDQDGQLEAVEHRIVPMEDGDYIQFTTNHFSPFGIYRSTTINGQAVVTDGKAVITSLSGNKDDTPDTGDFVHPKWFLALGLFACSISLFFYKGKRRQSRIR